jgi:hypothetical protein
MRLPELHVIAAAGFPLKENFCETWQWACRYCYGNYRVITSLIK